jgi:hypothetical protein
MIIRPLDIVRKALHVCRNSDFVEIRSKNHLAIDNVVFALFIIYSTICKYDIGKPISWSALQENMGKKDELMLFIAIAISGAYTSMQDMTRPQDIE